MPRKSTAKSGRPKEVKAPADESLADAIRRIGILPVGNGGSPSRHGSRNQALAETIWQTALGDGPERPPLAWAQRLLFDYLAGKLATAPGGPADTEEAANRKRETDRLLALTEVRPDTRERLNQLALDAADSGAGSDASGDRSDSIGMGEEVDPYGGANGTGSGGDLDMSKM